MNNPFTVEETNLICIFQSDSRTKVIEDIHKAMKHVGACGRKTGKHR